MTILESLALQMAARKEAKAGIDATEDHVIVPLGVRPDFDPSNNLEHGRVARHLNNRSETEELEEDKRNAEDELTRHTSPLGLKVLLVFLFVVEGLGCALVMRALGLENPDRTLMGIMLAAFVFFITFVAARAEQRGMWFYVLLATYGLLVLAVATLRVNEMASEDGGSAAADWAGGAVMLFSTIGPAWLAETLMRKLAPAVRIQKEIRNKARRIRESRVANRRAQKFVDKIARRQTTWDDQAARRRALYNRTHRRVSAELFQQPPV